MSAAGARRRRSDAQQNRERLLQVAAQAFAEQGLDVAPAAIARQAGVGVGTLYRHFPTREALIDAAYRTRLTGVCDKAAEHLRGHTAAGATRAWMADFLDYATAKNGMSEALDMVIASGTDPYADSRALLTAAVAGLLRAGEQDGTLRTDITPDDVLLVMGGTAHAVAVDRQRTREQTDRLVDLLMDALTAGAVAGRDGVPAAQRGP